MKVKQAVSRVIVRRVWTVIQKVSVGAGRGARRRRGKGTGAEGVYECEERLRQLGKGYHFGHGRQSDEAQACLQALDKAGVVVKREHTEVHVPVLD